MSSPNPNRAEPYEHESGTNAAHDPGDAVNDHPQLPTDDASSADANAPLPDYFLAGVIATGIAAAFVAVSTSFFGIQGTAIGAVGGAMAGSIASQVAKRRLQQVEHRARTAMRALVAMDRADLQRLFANSPRFLADLRARIPWRSIASAALIGVTGFAVGAVALSAVEIVSGRPISAVTSGEPAEGTTFGTLVEDAIPEDARPRRPTRTSTPLPGVTSPAPADTQSGVPATSPETVPAGSPEPDQQVETSPEPAPATRPPVASPLPSTPMPAASPDPRFEQDPDGDPAIAPLLIPMPNGPLSPSPATSVTPTDSPSPTGTPPITDPSTVR